MKIKGTFILLALAALTSCETAAPVAATPPPAAPRPRYRAPVRETVVVRETAKTTESENESARRPDGLFPEETPERLEPVRTEIIINR